MRNGNPKNGAVTGGTKPVCHEWIACTTRAGRYLCQAAATTSRTIELDSRVVIQYFCDKHAPTS